MKKPENRISLCFILHPSPFFKFPSYGLCFQPPWDSLDRTSPCLSLLQFSSNTSAYFVLCLGQNSSPFSAQRPLELSTNTALWHSGASTIHLNWFFFTLCPRIPNTYSVHTLRFLLFVPCKLVCSPGSIRAHPRSRAVLAIMVAMNHLWPAEHVTSPNWAVLWM